MTDLQGFPELFQGAVRKPLALNVPLARFSSFKIGGATKAPYDTLGDTYARFLLEEILPQVREEYNFTEPAVVPGRLPGRPQPVHRQLRAARQPVDGAGQHRGCLYQFLAPQG